MPWRFKSYVPGDVGGMGSRLPRLRMQEWVPDQRDERGALADEVARHPHTVVSREPDRSSVEELMVKGAQREGVSDLCGSFRLSPADVSSLQAHGPPAEPARRTGRL